MKIEKILREKKQQHKANVEEINKGILIELYNLKEKLCRRNKQIKALREENTRLRNANNS